MTKSGKVSASHGLEVNGDPRADFKAIFEHYDRMVGKKLPILILSPLTESNIKHGTDRPGEIH